MNSFDKKEKMIESVLSQITVDNKKLKDNIKHKLKDKEYKTSVVTPLFRKKYVSAAIAIIILIGGVYAARWGGFDWLVENLNPDFKEHLEAVEEKSTDKDIEFEVIGAQKYDNNGVIYLSVRDKSSKKRISENTDFLDGFYIKQINKDSSDKNQKSGKDIARPESGYSTSNKLLYFDSEKNTAFFEIFINTYSGGKSSINNEFKIGSSIISFDRKEYKGQLPLELINSEEKISIKENNILGGSGDIRESALNYSEILKPVKQIKLNDDTDDLWISNIGIIDGKLHIQSISLWQKEFGSSDPNFIIRKGDDVIEPENRIILLSDENNNLSSDLKTAKYKIIEHIFNIKNKDLKNYTLDYDFIKNFGVKGKWEVDCNLSDNNKKMRILTDEVLLDTKTVKRIIISPLGVELYGTCKDKEYKNDDLSFSLDFGNDIVYLKNDSYSSHNGVFQHNLKSKKPIDINALNAITINNVRIDLKK